MENFELEKPICNCTPTTRADVFVMILQIYKRHKLDWLCLEDLCKMINNIYQKGLIPSTKYKIEKKVGIDMEKIEYHIYCPNCQKYLKKSTESEFEIECFCGHVVNSDDAKVFVSIDFSAQLKNLIETQYSKKKFIFQNNRAKESFDSIEDVCDGKKYQLLQQQGLPLYSQLNFSYTFNLDGCKKSFSSNVTIWPTYAYLNELILDVRFKNTMLLGVWVDRCEPQMNTYLQPFVEKANFLSTNGLTWESTNDNQIFSKKSNHSLVIPTICSVDSMCRCKVLNMKIPNAEQGCTFCHHETKTVNGYKKFTYRQGIVPSLRTDEDMKESMIRAGLEDNPIMTDGIKGPSILMNLKYFDLASGMIPDDLHAIFLGQIKDLTNLLLTDVEEEYYIGSPANLEIIDKRLLSIRVPKCITRTPTSIKDRALWKASQWRSWLIFFVLPCIRDLLPRKYLEHISLLVNAIHICLNKSISPHQLKVIKSLFVTFGVRMQLYYGEKNMRYNFHLGLHVADAIENWGPMWLSNCFSFEGENKKILDLQTSPTKVATQLAKKYLFQSAINLFVSKFKISDHVEEFCKKIFSNDVKFFKKVGNVTLIGSGAKFDLTENELLKMPKFDSEVETSKFFLKIIVDGKKYTSCDYKREKKTDNSFFKCKNGDFGRIQKILYTTHSNSLESITIIYKNYVVKDENFLTCEDVTIDHIKECYTEEEIRRKIRFCNPSDLLGPCIHLHIDDKEFITTIPQGCLKD